MYLYGGRTPEALALLEARLRERFPGLRDRGRLLAAVPRAHRRGGGARDRATSTPRAPRWCGSAPASPSRSGGCARMRPRLAAPLLVGVGAAFDFHAGLVPQAPPWMQRNGLEWAYRLVARAAPAVAALRPLQPALRRRLRAPVRAPPPSGRRRLTLSMMCVHTRALRPRLRAANLLARMTASQSNADVAVVGLGRVGLPLALSFADRGLRVIGVDNDPRAAATRCATARCRSRRPAPRSCSTACTRAGGCRCPSASPTRPRARHIVITLGTPSFSHIEIDMRDIRSALDDLLGVLGAGHSLILRSTVAPGTTEFVAGYLRQAPRLSDRRGGVRGARARADRRRALPRGDRHAAVHHRRRRRALRRGGGRAVRRRSTRRSCRPRPCRPSWRRSGPTSCATRNFALPNLLMMDCERYGANVFEVIDLINRDYPRGGIAQPGFTAGTCLRKDFAFSEERSAAPGMLLAVSRVNESVPLFLVEGVKRRLGSLADRKVAVLGLAFKADTDDERDSLAHKLIRLLERELADVVVHDPHVADADRVARGGASTGAELVVVAANHSEFRDPAHAGGDRRARAARLPGGGPVELLGRRAGVRATPPSWPRSGRSARVPRDEPRARHRRRRHDRRRGRPAPARRPRLRGARLRPAPRAAVDARGLRGPHRRPARPRAGARGDGRLHAGDPPGRDRRRDRQLPPAAPHPHRGQQRALQRGHPRGARRTRSSASSTSPPRWCSSAPSSSRRPRTTCPTARCRSRPTASPSSPARSTAAPPTTSTGCRSRSAARSTPTAPARCPTPSRASPTPCPT